MPNTRRRVVYSTDDAVTKRCPRCGSFPCRCPQPVSAPPSEQQAHVRRETKGRGGKTVTVVGCLELTPSDLRDLGKALRKTCGTGGTVKDGVIELQGDHRETVVMALQALGYRAKITGG